jgi:hypothetical protein
LDAPWFDTVGSATSLSAIGARVLVVVLADDREHYHALTLASVR